MLVPGAPVRWNMLLLWYRTEEGHCEPVTPQVVYDKLMEHVKAWHQSRYGQFTYSTWRKYGQRLMQELSQIEIPGASMDVWNELVLFRGDGTKVDARVQLGEVLRCVTMWKTDQGNLTAVPVFARNVLAVAHVIRNGESGGWRREISDLFNTYVRNNRPVGIEIEATGSSSRSSELQRVRTKSFHEICEDVRIYAGVHHEWTQEELASAVRGRMLALDYRDTLFNKAKATLPDEDVRQDSALMTLQRRMRTWPEGVRFVYFDQSCPVEVCGYVSGAPVKCEDLLWYPSRIQGNNYNFDPDLVWLERSAVSSDRPSAFCFSSVRIDPRYQSKHWHTCPKYTSMRREVRKAAEEVLLSFFEMGYKFDRVYLFLHQEHVRLWVSSIQQGAAHVHAEKAFNRQLKDPMIARVHLRPWGLPGGELPKLREAYESFAPRSS